MFYMLFGMKKWMVVVSKQNKNSVNHSFIFKDLNAKFPVE